MSEKIVKSKLVNFLVADVEVNYEEVGEFYDAVGAGNVDVVAGVMESFKQAYGGLWVGGKMVLTKTAVHLNANALNRMVQDGTLDIEIPIGMIRAVANEGGFFTKIIRLDTDAGSVKFRCYGAKEVVALIERMIVPRVSTAVLKRSSNA
ncbi:MULTISPECIES: hypothetical protein [Pseudomonas]|jgi:hypothetical protein|uniref:Uncharacterized protein n=1 Tax=Pseudomonas fluorescens TaxID=294 RepID=A0A423MUN8_PSEFL|nr:MULTISPECIES: hypothetical protein [Pseudomonas]EJM03756.1 hypothetical protein PMI19_02474 [Pseudomonas sp. GM16]EJM40718.1 hypothetical protein PMI23_01992 [Pseudomonas sp. GM24]RON89089.1 hypothetical protein BK672_26795 [Pseudomonas fluorescens]